MIGPSCPDCRHPLLSWRRLPPPWWWDWHCPGCGCRLQGRTVPYFVVTTVSGALSTAAFCAALFIGPWQWALLAPLFWLLDLLVPVRVVGPPESRHAAGDG